MKLYAVRVEVTRWAYVHVVAESDDAATELAEVRANDILDDGDAEDEVEAEVSEATGGWGDGELPYLTDEAAEVEAELCGTPRGGRRWAPPSRRCRGATGARGRMRCCGWGASPARSSIPATAAACSTGAARWLIWVPIPTC